MRYSISRSDGVVLTANCRTPLGALRAARKLCWDVGQVTISEFQGKSKTGRCVMHVSCENETDWQHKPLDFWNDGQPII